MELIVVFFCISLITNEVEYFFIFFSHSLFMNYHNVLKSFPYCRVLRLLVILYC